MKTYKLQERGETISRIEGLAVDYMAKYQTVPEVLEFLGLSSFNTNFSKFLELNTTLNFITEDSPRNYGSDLINFLFNDLDFFSQGGQLKRYNSITMGKRKLEDIEYLYKKLNETLYIDLKDISYSKRALGGIVISNSQDCVTHILASEPLREDGLTGNAFSIEDNKFIVNCIYELPVKSAFNNYKNKGETLVKNVFPFIAIRPVVKQDLETEEVYKPNLVTIYKQFLIFDNGNVYVNVDVENGVTDELIEFYRETQPNPYFKFSNYIIY